MKNKKLLNQIAAIGGAVCLALAILASPVTTVPVQAAAPNDEVATPQRDIIEWRYKEVNGLVYRRLYNYTINAWVGDWEYIGRVS